MSNGDRLWNRRFHQGAGRQGRVSSVVDSKMCSDLIKDNECVELPDVIHVTGIPGTHVFPRPEKCQPVADPITVTIKLDIGKILEEGGDHGCVAIVPRKSGLA